MSSLTGSKTDSGDLLLRRMAARRRRESIAVIAVAGLAILGGGRAIFDAFDSSSSGPTVNTTTSVVGHAQLAGSFARDFVVTYLSLSAAGQSQLGAYVSGAQSATLPPVGRQVSDPAVAFVSLSSSESGIDIWSVTISVRSATRATAQTDVQRQFYRVAVSVGAGRVRALSLPAVVEPPASGSDLTLVYRASCAVDTVLGTVASGFLQALLTGSGDIARYTTAGSGIAALKPTPFTSVETATISADDPECGTRTNTARVLVSINPKGDGGVVTPTLDYPLTMVRTAGQWQVASVDPAPALLNPLTIESGPESQGGAGPTSTANRTPASQAVIPPPTQN
ncbi:conjugal transfer protein [Nocardia sp. NBC_00511]|uniref:conjugal transfer protein n=1 Tax=Nocardia sp. NBC_00511 TaxID=2903591 RepID=UPI002F913ED6